MAGLPRAGSTMLISLLSQNPRIHGVPVSGLCGIFTGIYANWDKGEFHIETPNPEAKRAVLSATLGAYHENAKKPIIIDKNRQWTPHILLLEEILGRKIKIIVPVRPIVEILASFEKIRQTHPLELTGADEAIGGGTTIAARAEYFAAPNGVLGLAYNATKDAVVAGFLDRLLFVDYNKLMNDPETQLKRIYEFLGEESFKHDFKNITRPGESNWRVHKFPGLHDVRHVFEKQSPDAKRILGDEVYARYNKEEPWEAWT